MGKNVKRQRPSYGDMANEVLTTPELESTDTPTPADTVTQKKEYTDTVTPTATDTPTEKPKKNQPTRTRTATPTPRYAPAHFPSYSSGERKTERLQLVVRPSTKARLADYARDHGTSSNEVVQRLLDDLLDEAGY